MKILVMTDSHRRLSYIIEMIEKEQADIVWALGDHSGDFEEASYVFPELDFRIVRGNCDFWDRGHEDEILEEVEGKKVLLTHGHLHGVKGSLDSLRAYGQQHGLDLICFGHTHREYLEKGACTLLNPGAAQDRKYAVIVINKNNLEIELKKL